MNSSESYLIYSRFKSHLPALISLIFLGIVLIGALFVPLLSPFSYDETHLEWKNLPPGQHFWFGTDDLGRDLFTRVWHGARISLSIGLAAACIDRILGVIWGGIAGFSGGHCDKWMMHILNILYSLPYLLVVILLVVVRGSGMFSLLLAMTITGWMTMARIVRSQILSLKERDFILAAKSMGAGFTRILFRHLIPNASGPIIVTLTLTVPSAIFVEAYLSFLGLGVQAPLASWGTMAQEGLAAIAYYPWRLFFPAFFISLTILAFNLLGDGLREAFDSREG
jgi:oligopeptide transport system permease protein